jgi:hypothetical protein
MRSDERRAFESRIDAQRATIASLKDQLGTITTAPLTKAEALARFDEWFGEETRTLAKYTSQPVDFTTPGADFATFNDTVRGAHRGVGTLLMAVGPMVREFYAKRMDEIYAERPEGLANAERLRQLAALRKKLFEAEVAEERIVVEAQRAGFAIPRRRDLDPRVLVEVL